MKTAEEFLKSKDISDNQVETFNNRNGWGYESLPKLLDEFAEEYAQKKLKEAAEKIDKEYRDNDTHLKDGYTSGYCYALDKAEQLVKSLIKNQ